MYYVYFKMNEKREPKIVVTPVQKIENGEIDFRSIQEFEGKPVVQRDEFSSNTLVLMYNDLNDLVLREINNDLLFLRTTSLDMDVFNELAQREGFNAHRFFLYSSEFFDLHPFVTVSEHAFFETAEVYDEDRLAVSVPSASMGLDPEQPTYFSSSVQIAFTEAMFDKGVVIPTLSMIPELLSLLTKISEASLSESKLLATPTQYLRSYAEWSFEWHFVNSILITVQHGNHFLESQIVGETEAMYRLSGFPGLLESYTSAKEAFQQGNSIRVSYRNLPFGSVPTSSYTARAYSNSISNPSYAEIPYKGTIHVEVVEDEPTQGSYITEITPDAIYYSFSGVYQLNTVDAAMIQFFREFGEVLYREEVLYDFSLSNSETSVLDGRPIIDYSYDDLDLTRIPS